MFKKLLKTARGRLADSAAAQVITYDRGSGTLRLGPTLMKLAASLVAKQAPDLSALAILPGKDSSRIEVTLTSGWQTTVEVKPKELQVTGRAVHFRAQLVGTIDTRGEGSVGQAVGWLFGRILGFSKALELAVNQADGVRLSGDSLNYQYPFDQVPLVQWLAQHCAMPEDGYKLPLGIRDGWLVIDVRALLAESPVPDTTALLALLGLRSPRH